MCKCKKQEFTVDQSDWWVDRIEILNISETGEQTICEIENDVCDPDFLSEKLSHAFKVVSGLEDMARDDCGSHLENEYQIIIKSMPYQVRRKYDEQK